ncbi:MAG: DUF423 domain-containing protein [Sphingomonadaceae bacterium]|nr:DUF423 domain-containing protein [Sphingomonadaceae bacterium]
MRSSGFWAAICAAMAIGAGAFGAHAAPLAAAMLLKTGSLYQLSHAIAALVLRGNHPRSAGILLIGSNIFALSLYAMALGAPRWLGAVTPLGGVLMIGGWACAAISFARRG